ncbi:MAG: hypothetical protein F4Y86_13175 [Gammaproteobacteria bacterium]|nr:hypothetical protein [Gammaproteobacteria bacterium]MXY53461.1 hypothetical protein [Gammaproteobacteria bacterium]MYB38824.1 hypothetical protein [Gammaproteobacteria bacterium]
MEHRHLNHHGYTAAAVDDIISRGRWQDWADLRAAAIKDASILDPIERVCARHLDDPYAQRYHFWMNHVRFKRTAA